jgi:hypothetical protein
MSPASRKRRNFTELARDLDLIAVRPNNQDIKWTWDTIGAALNISAPTAQHLVQWMRRNWVASYWTIATAGSDYSVVQTKSFRVALDGILGQQRHLITRLQTLQASAATLATIDPDPLWAALAARTAGHYRRRLEDEEEFQRTLIAAAV